MKQTLRDASLDADFQQLGYVVVPLLRPEQVAALREQVEPLLPPDRGPFFGPFRDGDTPEIRRRIHKRLAATFEDAASQLLVNHRIFLTTTLVKASGRDGFIPPHQDLSQTDERTSVSGNVWMSLEADPAVGPLFVVPGSHRWPLPRRGFPHSTTCISAVIDQLTEAAVHLQVPVGSAVVYHHSLIHGSSEQNSGRDRIAVAGGFAPRDEKLKIYVDDPSGQHWEWSVDDEFWLDLAIPSDWSDPDRMWRPEIGRFVRHIDRSDPPRGDELTAERVSQLVGRASLLESAEGHHLIRSARPARRHRADRWKALRWISRR